MQRLGRESRYLHLIGQVFGRLTVIAVEWSCARPSLVCECSCPKHKRTKVHPNKLSSGHTKSCGCLARELTSVRNTRHGLTKGYTQLPQYYLWHNARARARKKGLPFDIAMQDVIVPDVCPVLGMPLRVSPQGFGGRDGSPTLDRLNPSLGYVKGNIAVISYRANRIKNDSNPDELHRVADWLASELANSKKLGLE